MQQTPAQHPLVFSRRERTGIFSILAIIILILFLPYVFFFAGQEEGSLMQPGEQSLSALTDSMLLEEAEEPVENRVAEYSQRKRIDENVSGRLFYFDPNAASDEEWHSLGLNARAIRTVRNYLNKGGRFRKPEDITKIWGIDPSLAAALLPYVRIPEQKPGRPEQHNRTFTSHQVMVDVNLADSATWESLPGIGPSLARRIVQFREKLGGFYVVDQVSETFGLPDSVYRKIRPRLLLKELAVRKISLNDAGLEELKNHPYIRYRLANAIDAYRKQHGVFGSVSDIRKIVLVSDSIYSKLEPYLSVN